MENVVIYFDIIFAGSSSSVLTASTMLEVAASSWSSQVRNPQQRQVTPSGMTVFPVTLLGGVSG